MRSDDELRSALRLPDMSQIGVVVHDLDLAMNFYKSAFGLGPFVLPEISFSDIRYYGKPVAPTWRLAFCSLGPVELEIIQPIDGPSIYHDFLETSGEGLHHIGFDVKNMDELIGICQQIGINVIQSGRTKVGGFAYLDTQKDGGVIFELIQRASRRA